MFNYLNFSRRSVSALILSVLLVLSLSACGQKGNLYLPDISPAPNVITQDKEIDENANNETDKVKSKVIAQSNEKLPAAEAEK